MFTYVNFPAPDMGELLMVPFKVYIAAISMFDKLILISLNNLHALYSNLFIVKVSKPFNEIFFNLNSVILKIRLHN